MKRAYPARLLVLTAMTLFAFPITCNSILTRPLPEDPNRPYEYVEVLGSNIPQRVIKGQKPMIASPTSTMSAEAFQQAMDKQTGRVGK